MNTVYAISERLKLAAYLDEAGDDPASACAVLKQHNIHYAVLRSMWNADIHTLSDQSLKQLKTTLDQNNISVVAVISDLGKVESSHLHAIGNDVITRTFNLASYFQAGFIRVHAGMNQKTVNDVAIEEWMKKIAELAISASMTPLYEITSESAVQEPTDVAAILRKARTWRLLYDPVQLIVKKNQNPFARYWTLLQDFSAAIDVRDYKIGFGFKPVGYGDAKIKPTLSSWSPGVDYWCFLEPSLGRRYASATTKADTFKMSMEALENLLQ